MRYRPEGAVSIFLSGILLILIVFSCSIVDATRIHIAQGQAERALLNAGFSILASYDSHLQSQYGLFAKNFSSKVTIQTEILDYIQSSIQSKTIPTNRDQTKFNLYDYNIKGGEIKNQNDLLHADYIKLQLLEFMKYRAPLIALEPFLDKLDVIKKSSKTTEIIIQKNDVAEEVNKLQNSFCKLEMLIDGLVIDEGTNKLSLYPNYVKKMITSNNRATSPYTEQEISSEAYRKLLTENLWWVDNTIQAYKQSLPECEMAIKNVFDQHRMILSLQKEIEQLSKTISSLQINPKDNSSAVKELYKERSDLELLIIDEQEKLEGFIHRYKELDQLIYSTYLPSLQNLMEEYLPLEKFGMKGILEEALLEIEKIQEQTPIVSGKIDYFKETLNNQQGEYIQEVRESIKEEIERYETVLGIDEKGEMQATNSLLEMKGILEQNIEVITRIGPDLITLLENKPKLTSYWCSQSIGENREENKGLLKRLDINENSHIQDVDRNVQTKTIKILDHIEISLDGYSRNLIFEYGDMSGDESNKFSLPDLLEKAKNIFPSIELPDEGMIIADQNLPSFYIEKDQITQAYEIDEVNIEKSNQFLTVLKKLGDGFAQSAIQFRNDLYINEYILGMFQCAPEQNDAHLTLNNYNKGAHYLNYEVEYILFGNQVDDLNLLAAIGVIFGIRIALNMIHLISDGKKMNVITNLANTVAGWWTLGIGSIVITVVLTLIWAMLESVCDIQRLLKGEQIPIIKDSLTWETDILNGITEVFIDQSPINQEKSHSPSLKYEDYLRLFLLSGVVDEKIKLFRIMDLIQINISEERNEKLELINYVSAFEVEGEFEVNTIFFHLPFMPQSAKEMGKFFNFRKKVTVSY